MRKRKMCYMKQILQITKVKNFFESGFFGIGTSEKNKAQKSPVQHAFKTQCIGGAASKNKLPKTKKKLSFIGFSQNSFTSCETNKYIMKLESSKKIRCLHVDIC